MGVNVEIKAPVRERRKERRAHALRSAQMEVKGVLVPMRLLNLSSHGAMLESEICPAIASKVTFSCGNLTSKGSVAWVNGHRLGLLFERPIPQNQVASILPPDDS
jgi:hypothetical protein